MKTYIGGTAVAKPPPTERMYYEPALTGSDQRIARDTELVAWLARVHAEMEQGKREWPFNRRKLGEFLHACGLDTHAAIKADEDAIPIPEAATDVAVCMDRLKSASFLNGPVGNVCMILHRRAQVTPRRR